MRRAIMTVLCVALAIGFATAGGGGRTIAWDSGTPGAGVCPDHPPDVEQDGMDLIEGGGGVRLGLEGTLSHDPDAPFYLRRSTICLEPGATTDPLLYPYAYLIFVQGGELTVTVSQIDGKAVAYFDGTAQDISTTAPVELAPGDAVFLDNVEAAIANPSAGESTTFVTSAVFEVEPPPGCPRCFTP